MPDPDNTTYLSLLNSLSGQRQKSLKMIFWIPTLFKLLNKTQDPTITNIYNKITPLNSQITCIRKNNEA